MTRREKEGGKEGGVRDGEGRRGSYTTRTHTFSSGSKLNDCLRPVNVCVECGRGGEGGKGVSWGWVGEVGGEGREMMGREGGTGLALIRICGDGAEEGRGSTGTAWW